MCCAFPALIQVLDGARDSFVLTQLDKTRRTNAVG